MTECTKDGQAKFQLNSTRSEIKFSLIAQLSDKEVDENIVI